MTSQNPGNAFGIQGGTILLMQEITKIVCKLAYQAPPLNAYAPEENTISEYYNLPKDFDTEFYNSINQMLQIIASEGSLLGSGVMFIGTAKNVVDWVQDNNNGIYNKGLNFQNYYNKIKTNPAFLAESIKFLRKKELSEKNSNFNRQYSYLQKLQKAVLEISAQHAGGYLSKEKGIQGGYTIAAGTII